MRKESTIRKKVEKMRESNLAPYYATEIAALEWALGDTDSIPQRRREVTAQYGQLGKVYGRSSRDTALKEGT